MSLNKNSSNSEVQEWVSSQTWYQRISLSNGIETPGTINSKERLKFISGEDIKGKSVIDIGCNAGYYCLWAKQQGAGRVAGVELDEMRIGQAKTLASIEGLDIEYHTIPLAEATTLGRFDIVYCFAVVTEITDLLGSLTALANITGDKAYIELVLARPLFYLSRSPAWIKSLFTKKYSSSVIEMKRSKNYWTLAPSLGAIREIIGDDFSVTFLGKGPRYDMICIERKR
jgi:SAM-dependent methyltransferase